MQAILVLIVYPIFYSFIISHQFLPSFKNDLHNEIWYRPDSNKRLTLKFIIILNIFMFILTHHDCPGEGGLL